MSVQEAIDELLKIRDKEIKIKVWTAHGCQNVKEFIVVNKFSHTDDSVEYVDIVYEA